MTLAVTPEQARLLALVVDKAKLVTLSLRAFGDVEVKELAPVTEPLRLR